jgi:predicted transcriptional regulator
MMIRLDPEVCARLTTEIVTAYIGRSDLGRTDLVALIYEVRRALGGSEGEGEDAIGEAIAGVARASGPGVNVVTLRADEDSASGVLKPAVPIDQSVHEDYIVSLEDGRHYRSLRRHLMAKHGMTPDDYRRKWSLPPDYPMVAPSYAKERSEVARRTGLGRSAPIKRKRS